MNSQPSHRQSMSIITSLMALTAVTFITACSPKPPAEESAAQTKVIVDQAVAEAKKEMIAEQTAEKARASKSSPAQASPRQSTVAPPAAQTAVTPASIPKPVEKTVCANCGVVLSVREFETEGQGSGLGVVAGGVAGGLLGNQVGKGTGRDLATIAGAVGGAIGGNLIEKKVKKTKSYDITVKMETGEQRIFNQTTAPNVTSGDAVKIENNIIIKRPD